MNVVQLNLLFLLRPARAVVVSKSFQQQNQKMPILLYKNRENLMFYKEGMKLKGLKGFCHGFGGPKRYTNRETLMFSREPMKLKGQRPKGLGDQKDRSTACRGDTKNELLKQQQRPRGFWVLADQKDRSSTLHKNYQLAFGAQQQKPWSSRVHASWGVREWMANTRCCRAP